MVPGSGKVGNVGLVSVFICKLQGERLDRYAASLELPTLVRRLRLTIGIRSPDS